MFLPFLAGQRLHSSWRPRLGPFPPGLRRPGAVTFSAAAAAADVDVDVERGARADLGVAAVAVRG